MHNSIALFYYSISKSLGHVFKVQIEGESSSGTYCRVWSQVLDKYDGSYIVR